jgi:hypothetical protein
MYKLNIINNKKHGTMCFDNMLEALEMIRSLKYDEKVSSAELVDEDEELLAEAYRMFGEWKVIKVGKT